MLDDILICPKTHGRMTIDAANSIARVEGSDLSYPIKDGIIDFLSDTEDRVTKAYDSCASSYDNYMNLSGLTWKLFGAPFVLLVWGFLDGKIFIDKPLGSIPDDFDGVLLDVPVGTGVFTSDKYRKLNKARIIAIDYSLAMLQKAQERYLAPLRRSESRWYRRALGRLRCEARRRARRTRPPRGLQRVRRAPG